MCQFFLRSHMLDYIRSTLPFHLALLSAVFFGLLSLLFVFLFFVSNLKARKEHASVPSSLPWMGTKPQAFSAIRANFRGLVDSIALYTQGYRKVSSLTVDYISAFLTTSFSFLKSTKYSSCRRGRKGPKSYYPLRWAAGLPLAQTRYSMPRTAPSKPVRRILSRPVLPDSSFSPVPVHCRSSRNYQ